MAADYEELEKLVAKIQAELAPDAEVLHNQRLPGTKSGRQRQIDVLVRQRVGQYEIRIVIDCKDYKKPADVKSVEEFYGLMDDVGAQKGVLVCPSGFSQTAKNRAEGLQIDLYSPVDTDPHKWQAKVEIPALCDFRSAAISFGISSSTPHPFMLPYNFFAECKALDKQQNDLGTPLEAAVEKWNSGGFTEDLGIHEKQPIFPEMEVLVDNGYGTNIPVKVYAGLAVSRELYFGQLPITKISGFRDEVKGGVITNAFEVGILSPEDVEKNWTRIESEKQAPIKPVIGLIGRVAWEA